MDNRFAVIDLGSNTFHILIVDLNSDGSFSQIHKERSFVGLAENGIEILSDQAADRGIKTLTEFAKLLDQYQVGKYQAIGTSALRSANNSEHFLQRVLSETGLKIDIIDGSREAELIYNGVSSISHSTSGNYFIMDVGGGSVEFILVENNQLTWSKSYDIGVGVLFNLEELSDPISTTDISALNSFLDEKLIDLEEIVSSKSIDTMIGASGSFEIIQSLNGDNISTNEESEINLNNYFRISEIIKKSSLKERKSMKGLPASRAKLVVVAFLLIDKAIEIIKPTKLLVSPYSLKEGVLSELS